MCKCLVFKLNTRNRVTCTKVQKTYYLRERGHVRVRAKTRNNWYTNARKTRSTPVQTATGNKPPIRKTETRVTWQSFHASQVLLTIIITLSFGGIEPPFPP